MRGLTKKPCPGCGNDEYPHKIGSICRDCRQLLKEAKENRLRLKAMTGKMKIAVGEAYHWNKGYLEGDLSRSYREFGEHYDLRAMLLRIMVSLIKELSEKSYDDPHAFKAPIVLKGLGSIYQYDGSENQARYIDRKLFGLLRGLDRLIRLALKRSYENGKEYGASLIKRLAAGDITIEKFQKEVEREG